MKRSIPRLMSLAVVLGAAMFTLTSSACTVVLPLAAARTSRIPSHKVGWPTGRVKSGQRVIVLLSDSSQVAGRYRGTRPFAGTERQMWYASRLPQWVEHANLCLALGEPVTVLLTSGERIEGNLAELDRQGIAVSRSSKTIRHPLGLVDLVVAGGDCTVTRATLRAIPSDDWLRSPVRILLETDRNHQKAVVPDSVVHTALYPRDHRIGASFGVGLLADVAIVAAVASSIVTYLFIRILISGS